MKMLLILPVAALLSLLASSPVTAQQADAVQLYSQDDLLDLIKTNSHLRQVRSDDCQLVQDIEARADIMQLPAYQFLYGDMLAYAVCVPRNVERGWDLMLQSAAQGLPEALEQVGRYYHIGRFVQVDIDKALVYLHEAAAMGNLNAKLRYAQLLVDGYGSPVDYEQSYRWLHHAISADANTHARITKLLQQLAKKMPERVVTNARRPVK
ncbi:MAG: flagellar protein MotX [Rheinheimera sp.]|uniref:tetratricopeptide repeat protein n=1 Tax=Arsukibacterium sp. UBA3155 TaxID=1946058 RepID=UPI000C965524|nr:flagellar protein MotX [Arsukibacterium sp. UBA3155]MAD74273.1 flagellar protein MotX [Rheinheimera sp.]|tara:strand:+ start:47130 stop:47756 length:627 start_codon:yes stop_codon:yes gene_type:complete